MTRCDQVLDWEARALPDGDAVSGDEILCGREADAELGSCIPCAREMRSAGVLDGRQLRALERLEARLGAMAS